MVRVDLSSAGCLGIVVHRSHLNERYAGLVCLQWTGKTIGTYGVNFTMNIEAHDTAALFFTPGTVSRGKEGLDKSDKITIVSSVVGTVVGIGGLVLAWLALRQHRQKTLPRQS